MSVRSAEVKTKPSQIKFKEDVLNGLRSSPKRLSCKYFYDERGSRLFDKICELDEYYLTRTESSIMEQYAKEMGEQLGAGVALVEFGSGSSTKTRILLDNLIDPVAYIPVDISRDHLLSTVSQLLQEYSGFEILPVCADFTQDFQLPKTDRVPSHYAVYFPGSTIGNFEPASASKLLCRISSMCGMDGGLLIGIDLKKDPETLERAYDDSDGVTADFNLNLISRIERELDSDIDVSDFEHHSFYNEDKGRVEIYVRSCTDQIATVEEEEFEFTEGELIHTEYSHKYTIEEFSEIASESGFRLHKSWTDEDNYFAILHFVVEPDSG